MSFSPYLYFSFVFITIFSILEVTKNFKHSVLLKVQFIGLLTFASIVNIFLFNGHLSQLELSIVRLLIDIMPMFVLNIALILYAYKIPAWVFISEGVIALLGLALVYGYAGNFTSVLKLHPAGYLAYQTGNITDRGSGHHYWSSDYSDATFARAYVVFPTSTYTVSNNNRLAGFSVRCIRD